MSSLISTTRDNDRFDIVLNRPEKRNAINIDMLEELDEALREANQLVGIRAVFIRGEGPTFSSGVDVTALMSLAQSFGENWQQRMRSITDDFQRYLTTLERLEIPTVALLHGHCLGLGMELALACDMRIAATETKLGLPETRLGLIPDVGGTTRLTRLVGPARAKELIFTGRQIDATQAEAWGIVNHAVPKDELEAKGEELLEELRKAAPLAVGMAKRVIDGLADIDRGLMLEGWAQSELVSTDDFAEAMQSFMEKRSPTFEGR